MEKKTLNTTGDNSFFLNGDIDEHRVQEVFNTLWFQSPLEGENSLYFFLNTYGGDVYDAFAIRNLLQTSPYEITIICAGKIMSAGLIVLTGADNVYSYRDTSFMIHDVDLLETKITKTNIDSIGKNVEMINNKMYQILSDFTQGKSSFEELKRLGAKESYFDSNQALTLGLIHGFI